MLLTGVATGCQSQGRSAEEDLKLRKQLAAMVYPAQAKTGPDLDILAQKRGSNLVLTNREPRSFRKVQIWVNQQYVTVVPEVAIGTLAECPLSQVINEHGEVLPHSLWLHPDQRTPVLLTELYDPATGLRHRLSTIVDTTYLR